MELRNGFCELSKEEMMDTEGGAIPLIAKIVIGGLVTLAVAATTKGCADADAADN
ncbi:MAG: class IIb bacteriocin, lactobin A/cerein 7B family [Lachnospiraceae bacterium]|nr:class IIb bacteriocin, lactobin A/cerein 7B family [Lachnospiraceae bacterium]